jgi:hypothetical protein
VAKKGNKWYAPNEEGIFMFEVPIDKVLYPTTRFLRDDLAVIVDTHGVNMLVEQAVRLNASVVVGCCDHPGKAKASAYLSQKGISVICNTDRSIPMIMGQNLNVLGSAPFEKIGDSVVIGGRPLEFNLEEPIVVQNISSEIRGHVYYDTPTRYFVWLEKLTSVHPNLAFVQVSSFDQMENIIIKAEKLDARVIAVRIFSLDDYNKVKAWLEKSRKHKAILFHSEAYPYGYLLAREFKWQTSFDDINPILKK